VPTKIIDRQLIDEPSAVIGIVLGQLLYQALTTPEYVLLVAEDVLRKWEEHLPEREVARQLLNQVDPLNDVPESQLLEHEVRELQRFVDQYVGQTECNHDLPNDTAEKLWFAHALKLAPDGHPIHTSVAARIGADPGV
jgi:hypothetical protein